MSGVFQSLGQMLKDAISKFISGPTADKKSVEELVKGVQRALLMSDVDVQLVLKLSENVKKRALEEDVPPGISRKEHVVKIVYEELISLLGRKPVPLDIPKDKPYVIMLVGIQGSGKTTTAAKMAIYLKKSGYSVGVVCADTYRPGAYDQLSQLLDGKGVAVYGDPKERDPVKLARRGIEELARLGNKLIIIDTAGRHKDQGSLMKEMVEISKKVNPHEVTLVIDGTIGQQARPQAEAFNRATPVGSIVVTKVDTSARGGGALSAVAATGAKIRFVGTGEKVDEIESFNPTGYVGRLLGIGDIEGLIERVRMAEVKLTEEQAKHFLRGEFTLEEFINQVKELKKLGPLKKVLSRLPFLDMSKVHDSMIEAAESQVEKWVAIINSMTKDEREDPKLLNSSRVRRIAKGAGVTEKDVKMLVKQYVASKKIMKRLKRGKGLEKLASRLGMGA